MSFGRKFKMLRQGKDLSQLALSKKLGISNVTISQYESGTRNPDLETLSHIANYFGVSTDYLLGNEKPANQSPKKNAYKIPVYGEIAAGIPLECIEDIEDWEEIDEDTNKRGEIFALKIRGDSMSPLIKNKDVVLLRAQNTFENGEICAVHINGGSATLKKVKKDENGIFLIPLNPAYDAHYYSIDQINELPITVIGKLIELRRKF